MKKQYIIKAALIAAAISTMNAQAYEFGKPITVNVTSSQTHNLLGTSTTKKQITLMNIKLTPNERNALLNFNPKQTNTLLSGYSRLPTSVNLGMNDVPVLDQGNHGSCVTFANTAAVDAVLGKGDYVSQLCNLELGNYLEKEGYLPSGWDGSYGPWIIEQMLRFGVVNKDNQNTQSCAEMKEYPTEDGKSVGNVMSADDFKSMSEDISTILYPNYLMSFNQRLSNQFVDTNKAEETLQQVKEALSKGNRLTVGTFLVLTPYCRNAGACASYRVNNDTWAITRETQAPPMETAGHEMVIIAYDDKAVAVDGDGKRYRGLLTLRNSWGSDIGDHGDFYMTYDYFKKFAGEVQEIVEFKR